MSAAKKKSTYVVPPISVDNPKVLQETNVFQQCQRSGNKPKRSRNSSFRNYDNDGSACIDYMEFKAICVDQIGERPDTSLSVLECGGTSNRCS